MAQFGRALRSGRRGRKFESCRLDDSLSRLLRPHGQAVKTTPSHGVNPGSIPGEVIECFGQRPKHFYAKGRGICPLDFADASVAQLVAQRIRNAWVAGSSPAGSLENKGFKR